MKFRLGFVSNSSSSSFIAGYGSVSEDMRADFEETMKFFGAKVYKANELKSYFNVMDIFFPEETKIHNDCMTVFYEGKEDETYWWDNDTEEAKDRNFWDAKRNLLITCLEDGYFFDKNKPYNYTFGVWHS